MTPTMEALKLALEDFVNEARLLDKSGGAQSAQELRWLDGWVDCIGRLAQDADRRDLWVLCVALRTALMRLLSGANRGEFHGLTSLEALSSIFEGYFSKGDSFEALQFLAQYLETFGHQAWSSADTDRVVAALSRTVLPIGGAEVSSQELEDSPVQRETRTSGSDEHYTTALPESATNPGDAQEENSFGRASGMPSRERVAMGMDPTDLPQAIAELSGCLLAELDNLKIVLGNSTIVASSEEVDATTRQQVMDSVAEQVRRLGGAAQAVGLLGLHRVFEQVHRNLNRLASQMHTLQQMEQTLLIDWIERVYAYLRAPTDRGLHNALARSLSDSRWPSPVDLQTAQEIEMELADILVVNPELDTSVRADSVNEADLVVSIPSDINPDVLDGLLREMSTQTEEFSVAVQRLVAGGTLEDVNVAQRIAHNIKGAGTTVGVKGITNLTHHLEDILATLAQEKVLPTQRLGNSLMKAADCLKAMCEVLVNGGGAAPSEARDVLQEILDWANLIDWQGLPLGDCAPARSELAATGNTTGAIVCATSKSSIDDTKGKRSNVTADDETAVSPFIRVPVTLIDELLRRVDESIILTDQARECANRVRGQAGEMQQRVIVLKELGAALAQLIDDTDVTRRHEQSMLAAMEFDALDRDRYTDLYTHSRRLMKAGAEAADMGNCLVGHLNDLDKILMNKERLNGDTQEAVVSMRMVPVKTIFPRLQRSVRQTCRLNGKQVELHLTGGDIMMDSEALNSLVDPIMHLLRNAIDHGIEEREAREHSGKVEGGNVHLDFLRDGSNILIRCKDDGHGLDFEAIRHKAYEIGLLSADQTVDEEALKRFILLANFSTQSNTTQTSGRGIGLDVVNTKVEELGGSITLESQYGRGCQFDLRLPVSLISSHVPRVRTGAKAFAQITRGDSSPSGEGEPRLGGQEKDPNERIRSVAELLMGFEWISAT